MKVKLLFVAVLMSDIVVRELKADSLELRVQPRIYFFGEGYLPYYPTTVVRVKNSSNQKVFLWLEERSGAERHIRPLIDKQGCVSLLPGSVRTLIWRNFEQRSSVVKIIAANYGGVVIAAKEIYINGNYGGGEVFEIRSR